ncbi:MAG: RES domain-containing protein [Nitrosospira sp.]|nr:RES domain-containing protein [Nitrosospira sp.]
MQFWRLYKTTYNDPLSGEGAKAYGGRWNLPGQAALYLADTPALAMVEILARAPSAQQAKKFRAALVEIDARSLPVFALESLPAGWDSEPPITASQRFGSERFNHDGLLGFRVPSVVVPLQTIAVVNTGHRDFHSKIRLVRADIPFPFDLRLLSE